MNFSKKACCIYCVKECSKGLLEILEALCIVFIIFFAIGAIGAKFAIYAKTEDKLHKRLNSNIYDYHNSSTNDLRCYTGEFINCNFTELYYKNIRNYEDCDEIVLKDFAEHPRIFSCLYHDGFLVGKARIYSICKPVVDLCTQVNHKYRNSNNKELILTKDKEVCIKTNNQKYKECINNFIINHQKNKSRYEKLIVSNF